MNLNTVETAWDKTGGRDDLETWSYMSEFEQSASKQNEREACLYCQLIRLALLILYKDYMYRSTVQQGTTTPRLASRKINFCPFVTKVVLYFGTQ